MGVAIFILLSSVFVFFSKIASFPLRNWDEAWYAELIKNMASGKYGYLMPFWNGRYYFDHAPLYFWLSAPVFKIFGAGEWQARFVSATAAILVVFLIFKIGKKLKDKTTGLISALVFLTFGGIVIRFAHGNLDALLICFFLASFYFYLQSEKKRIFGFFAGALIGLGFLIKSWGIGLFPLVLIFMYAYVKDKKLPRNLFLIILGILIFSSWWYFLSDKSDWYIIPALALISLVIGYLARELYKIYPKVAIGLISLLFIAQILNAKRVENIYPDRSKTGATLGLHAKDLIPKSAKIILNDQDFTSFLFYSSHLQIYTLENKTPKENEWWILNSASLMPFLRENPKTWIITADLSNLPFEVKKEEVIDYWGDYYFVNITLPVD